jgi:hypothetical protein
MGGKWAVGSGQCWTLEGGDCDVWKQLSPYVILTTYTLQVVSNANNFQLLLVLDAKPISGSLETLKDFSRAG